MYVAHTQFTLPHRRDDGRILRSRVLSFSLGIRHVNNIQILDITASEYDELVYLIP